MKCWQGSLQLLPRSEAQERIANLREFEDYIANSSSERFVASAIEFRNAFIPGDTIVEFCSDKTSWRAGMGLAGFLLRRDGADVARLICRMN